MRAVLALLLSWAAVHLDGGVRLERQAGSVLIGVSDQVARPVLSVGCWRGHLSASVRPGLSVEPFMRLDFEDGDRWGGEPGRTLEATGSIDGSELHLTLAPGATWVLPRLLSRPRVRLTLRPRLGLPQVVWFDLDGLPAALSAEGCAEAVDRLVRR